MDKSTKVAISLPEHILKEIAYLFETYKVLEGKKVKVIGWENASAAKAVIQHCQQVFQSRDKPMA